MVVLNAAHRDYHLEEFTFRFRRRTSGSLGMIFYRLLQNAVGLPPTPYRAMVRGPRSPANKRYNI